MSRKPKRDPNPKPGEFVEAPPAAQGDKDPTSQDPEFRQLLQENASLLLIVRDLSAAYSEMLAANPVLRSKGIGAPGSPMRKIQDASMAAADLLEKALGRAKQAGAAKWATNGDIAAVIESLLALIDDMMPGVAKIALQDYRRLNEAPLNARRLIKQLAGGGE